MATRAAFLPAMFLGMSSEREMAAEWWGEMGDSPPSKAYPVPAQFANKNINLDMKFKLDKNDWP
jgi:hypothetical protein